jgi:hypothetical protein
VNSHTQRDRAALIRLSQVQSASRQPHPHAVFGEYVLHVQGKASTSLDFPRSPQFQGNILFHVPQWHLDPSETKSDVVKGPTASPMFNYDRRIAIGMSTITLPSS